MKYFGIAILTLSVISTALANGAHEMLIQLDDAKRNSTLSTYMLSIGYKCEVTRNFYQGATEKGDAFWNVECRDGSTYAIMIENNAQGSTRILECEVIELGTQVACFQKLE